MVRKFKTMDGNNAAAHVSYAYTEVAGIYPITPSSPMADFVDQWSAAGLKNIFGTRVKVAEMQSEAGAAGTVHGSLGAGALTTTYTASQGLLLMIPNMYKIAAEQLPCVFHVSARTVSTHALNIFGDHSDVMACRQTGFAMLCETNPQEVMDLSPVAHLAAIEGKVPFLNFFDGFRTSHEIQKVAVWDFADLKEMCNMQAVEEFRQHALNPEHPAARGCHENGDIFFQHREACNQYYNALPAVVEKYMGKINEKLGTNYQLFNYYGAPDADRVIIAMGSINDVAEEVIDYMNAHGEKVGLVKVRLYRPFCADKLVAAIPATAKKIAVLDRTKEPGSLGEPLYMDVVTALANAGVQATVIGGRYGLGSKDTPPASIFAVYNELKKDQPKREFTIGIVDDVTNLSLEEDKNCPNTAAEGTIECKFWGLGGDGTVGEDLILLYLKGDGSPEQIAASLGYAKEYLLIMLVGFIPFTLAQCYSGTLRETGQTVVPMVAGVVSVVVNLCFNTLLIFGYLGFPRLGASGAAIATVIARFVEAGVVMLWAHRNPERVPYLRGVYRSFHIPAALARAIARKSIPLLLNETLWAAGMALLAQCYSVRGYDVVSAYNICSTVSNVFNGAFMAMGNAVGILVGQLLGAGKMEDFAELFTHPGIDAGLAASIFHTRQVDIKELKRYLRSQGVEMRV